MPPTNPSRNPPKAVDYYLITIESHRIAEQTVELIANARGVDGLLAAAVAVLDGEARSAYARGSYGDMNRYAAEAHQIDCLRELLK